MTANKFATMLNKNTNKITLVLVYAILEWVLILLLLLNSLFSYLIIKFADYFGLKRPCLWCSRLDHLFEPMNFRDSHRSLVCEAHATEISRLDYCFAHKKLAEWEGMCGDCLSSSTRNELFSDKFAFFPWMKQLGVAQGCKDGADKVGGNGEVNLECSCCGASLEKKLLFRDCHQLNGFWEDLDYTQKWNLSLEGEAGDRIDEVDWNKLGFTSDHVEEEEKIDENKGVEIGSREDKAEDNKASGFAADFKEMLDNICDGLVEVAEEEKGPEKRDDLDVPVDDRVIGQNVAVEICKDGCTESQPRHLEFFIDQKDCHLIPIESAESNDTQEKQVLNMCEKNEEEDFVLEFGKDAGTRYELVEGEDDVEEEVPLLSVHKTEEQSEPAERFSGMPMGKDVAEGGIERVAISQATQTPAIDGNDVKESSAQAGEEMERDDNPVSEELLQMPNEKVEAEIPDQELIDDTLIPEVSHLYSCLQEDPSTSKASYCANGNHVGSEEAEGHPVEFRTIAVEMEELATNNHLPPISESNEIEEDAIPDTPTSTDGLHHIHGKLLMLERKESGLEESLDGSVTSDIEAGDGFSAIEKLKSALRAERKALNALYMELEEERNASAVAANQTMAMINRLQEEKATMQMEALQYQRMMEEQSEFDQEALQLLNDLMVKREKEKDELEKELEVYRKKVKDYEAREKMMMSKRKKDDSTRSGMSSASCSNSEDDDGVSVDLNHERKEEVSFIHDHEEISDQNTPVDAVLYLEESLANFEEERLSILEQLKVLEEKLFMLSDEDEQHFEDVKPIELLYEVNGNGFHVEFDHSGEVNGIANGHYKEMNGKHHHERKNIGAKGKRLLPLFDAIDLEAEDGMLNGHAEMEDGHVNGHVEGVHSIVVKTSVTKLDSDDKKLAVEEEVDHVYERLQALEADREFLKHCITSLRKGDKGIELLQEILQHLRDLRSVELRVRNVGDGVAL